MRLFIFTVIFLVACIISGASQAQEPFMTFDNPSWTREEMILKRVIDRTHSKQTATNHEYIFKDKYSTADRVNQLIEDHIQIPEKEVYVGR